MLQGYLSQMEEIVGNNTTTGDQVEEIPEVITHYTAEEIEGSQYLFGIGATQPTYVVAAFNEDFTEVVITKNGEESDGIMMDFAPWTSMQYSPMYNNRNTLQTAIIEEGVVNIGRGVSGGKSFNECTNLTNIQIATSVIDMNSNTFYDTAWYNSQPDGLVYINEGVYGYKGTCPSTVTIAEGTKRIYDSAFEGDELTSIIIPNGVISIGSYVFDMCSNLTSIMIPSSVTTFGEYAFKFIENINVTIYCETQEVADLLIDGTHYYSSTATVMVDPSKF